MGTHPPAYKKSGLIRSRLSLFCYVFLLVILFAFKGSNLNAHLADTSVLNVENGEVEVFVGDLVHIAVLRQEVKKTDDEAAKCIVVALGYDFTHKLVDLFDVGCAVNGEKVFALFNDILFLIVTSFVSLVSA